MHSHAHGELWNAINALTERLDQMEASQQGQIDSITSELGDVSTALAAAQTTLQAEIDKLSASNPQLDLTALQAAADKLAPAVTAIGGLVPDPVVPPVVPPATGGTEPNPPAPPSLPTA